MQVHLEVGLSYGVEGGVPDTVVPISDLFGHFPQGLGRLGSCYSSAVPGKFVFVCICIITPHPAIKQPISSKHSVLCLAFLLPTWKWICI